MKKRLLLLNWRDPWHPKSGGAELVTLRVLERLAKRGWDVEWFSSLYPGARPNEVRCGITFAREGSAATVHLAAVRRYSGMRGNRFSIAVDQINTIPFFTPFYLNCRKVAFFHQLAREVWLYEAQFPLSIFGFLSEPIYLQAYRSMPIITVSPSSAESLKRIGMRGPMHVIPEAVDEECDASVPTKHPGPDIAIIGRVNPSKRIPIAIEAAAILRQRGWRGVLHIVGAGSSSYEARIRSMAQTRLGDQVIIHGRVSDERRTKLLRDCSALWMTSVREGWGLVVTEAARHGTPAVVVNVAGLRDAVQHEITGLVVPANASAVADATEVLFADLPRYAGFLF